MFHFSCSLVSATEISEGELEHGAKCATFGRFDRSHSRWVCNYWYCVLLRSCDQVVGNPQTFHQALLLMASLARLAPESVLHNVMPIFTFMGSNVFHRDDTYSFRVIQKVCTSPRFPRWPDREISFRQSTVLCPLWPLPSKMPILTPWICISPQEIFFECLRMLRTIYHAIAEISVSQLIFQLFHLISNHLQLLYSSR